MEHARYGIRNLVEEEGGEEKVLWKLTLAEGMQNQVDRAFKPAAVKFPETFQNISLSVMID